MAFLCSGFTGARSQDWGASEQQKAFQEASPGRSFLARDRGLKRLKQDLLRIADSLEQETRQKKTLEEYSEALGSRIQGQRGSGEIDPRLNPVLDQLHSVVSDLPQRDYARLWAQPLVRIIPRELRRIAEEAGTSRELLDMCRESLVLPADPELELAPDKSAFFPTDIPLPKFKKLSLIRVFLMKHRKPSKAAPATVTPEDLVAGKYNVQVWIELTATVTGGTTLFPFDGDHNFDIGGLHLEITPEWHLAHPDMPLPQKGDRVRLRGWTYYDRFHKAGEGDEEESDSPVRTQRDTLWEVHPVQSIEILQP